MIYFKRLALIINILLAAGMHGYTAYYLYQHHGQSWAIAGLALPGFAELALCFVSVYDHDAVFNRYTIIFFSYLIVGFGVRYALDDLCVALANRTARDKTADAENALVLEAVQAAENGDYKLSCRKFLAVLRHNHTSGTACFGVGTSLLMQGKGQLALPYIEKAAFLGCVEARSYLAGLGMNRPKAI
ncbi:hypothetical protein [Solidesulfovibrio magneticus]|uniref:Hypothetical membrane protein n=1 Tax=Solidesulfovibrio magneticus (strain ATCC 700980 / DSM 13731 / RS-1) TaxID=573370 RepID=C4XN45_SOLM1|nr:hypothetical protein [Solidesulfovibrio magneticus]BAH77348.1 hypothetical membrane protein [Solidesulfovibrio magneticus RS-1]